MNGERAVLYRLGGRYAPIGARLTTTEVSSTLGIAQLRARTFDFAVATLRQDAELAPDRGVFRYPGLRSAPTPPPPPGAPF